MSFKQLAHREGSPEAEYSPEGRGDRRGQSGGCSEGPWRRPFSILVSPFTAFQWLRSANGTSTKESTLKSQIFSIK